MNYFWVYIMLELIVWGMKEFLRCRQRLKKEGTTMPPELGGKITPADFIYLQRSTLAGIDLESIADGWTLIMRMVLVCFLPHLWEAACEVAKLVVKDSDMLNGSIFTAGAALTIQILYFPFKAYAIYRMAKHKSVEASAFASRTLWGLLWKPAVAVLAMYVLMPFSVWGFGDVALWIYLIGWVIAIIVETSIFVQSAPYPYCCVSKCVSAFPESPLRHKIKALCRKADFPLGRIYLIEVTRLPSGMSPIYFRGCKRLRHISIFSPILKQMTDEEILALLAQEMGRRKWMQAQIFGLAHFITTASIAAFLVLCKSGTLYESFRFRRPEDMESKCLGVILYAVTCLPTYPITGSILNLLNRWFIRRADNYVVSMGLGSPLKTAITKNALKSGLDLDPDWVYANAMLSEPALAERLRAIEREEQDGYMTGSGEEGGQQGEQWLVIN